MDENKPLLIVVGILLVAFLAVPLLDQGSAPAAGGAKGAAAAAPVSTGPNLTSSELGGSSWQVVTQYGSITVQLQAGGQFVATPDSMISAQVLQRMAGTSQIVGSWAVDGASIVLDAQAGSQPIHIKGQIQGRDIMVDGKPATRLQ